MTIKKIIVILVIFGVLSPNFFSGQSQLISPPPGTLKGAKEIGERAIKGAIESLPKILERIWKGEVLPIWQGMYNWAKRNLWDPYIWPLWQRIQAIFKKEVEKRKEIIEEKLEREKEELKKEVKEEVVPKAFKSLWEKFKELIK